MTGAYRKRGCLSRTLRVLLPLALIALLAAGGYAWWTWKRFQEPYQGYGGPEAVVTIAPGTGASEILETLAERGVLRDATLTRLWLIHGRGDPPLAAGEYRFSGPLRPDEVLDKLMRGEVVTHPVTVIEGLTLEETAAELAAAGFGDEERFLAAMRDPAPVADLDPDATDLEGYLFPDTYSFARGTTEEEIVAALITTFRRRWEEQVAPLLPAEPAEDAAVATPRDVVTLASIVEKEAQLADERPVIAGVYTNRLERGIALYADPTVIFALKLEGRWDGNIRRPDLQLDSPYNTYRYPGLPPGPIASPGLASLQAAAEPAEVDYLYFVSRNDGSHVFSRTLAEHNRQVNEWQRRYWRRRAAARAAEGSSEGVKEPASTAPSSAGDDGSASGRR